MLTHAIIGCVVIVLCNGLNADSDEPFCYMCSANQSHTYLGYYCSQSKFCQFNHYAVSTDSEPCAAIGKEILSRGGNAVDAIIAVLLCMGVTIPESLGLGGGSFITIYNATEKEAYTIDAREVAPINATHDMYNLTSFNYSLTGPLAIAIPGELAGYWYMYNNHASGKIAWKDLFTGSISLARNGFKVSEHLENSLRQNERYIRQYEGLRNIFLNPQTNLTYHKNEILVEKQLADTLELLANKNDPKTYFYEVLARDIVDDINAANWTNITPIITYEDFQSYNIRINKSVKNENLRGNLTLHTFPLPGSGNLLSFIFEVMQNYDDLYPNAGQSLNSSVLFYHRLIETFKFAFSRRMHLGDDAFDDTVDVVKNLTSKEFANQVLHRINDSTTYPSNSSHYDAEVWMSMDGGTAHVSIVDKDGNAAAVTSTINSYLGSKVISPKTGILLNNEMDDFNTGQTNQFGFPPSDANEIQPRKRPLSSMVPSVFADDSGVRLVIGASGGSKITTAVSYVAIRHLWMNEDIKTAIDAPRIHHQLFPDVVTYEYNFAQNIVDGLALKGHTMEMLPESERGAVVMAVSGKNGKLYANSDYRKGGTIDGNRK